MNINRNMKVTKKLVNTLWSGGAEVYYDNCSVAKSFEHISAAWLQLNRKIGMTLDMQFNFDSFFLKKYYRLVTK